VAGEIFHVPVKAVSATGQPQTLGGDIFYAVVENGYDLWRNPGTISGSQRQSNRLVCAVKDNGNGEYDVTGAIHEQGYHVMNICTASPAD